MLEICGDTGESFTNLEMAGLPKMGGGCFLNGGNRLQTMVCVSWEGLQQR